MGKIKLLDKTFTILLRTTPRFQILCSTKELSSKTKNAVSKSATQLPDIEPTKSDPPEWNSIHEEKICLFHKPTNKTLFIQLEHTGKEITNSKQSLFLNGNEKDVQNYLSSAVNAKLQNHVKQKEINLTSDPLWKELCPSYNIKPYLSLAKIRLTGFVVMTSMAGYILAPGSYDLITFLSCSGGVLLTSSAANAVNQFFEVPFDSQMARTMNRPIVKGLITPQQAVAFAAASSSLGLLLLCCGTNLLTATLGLTNMVIYTLIYTPMKRTNISNTWAGSVVGAIPPMMGWAAATGHLDAGAWLLGGVLFAWQFPHFCALSWNLQGDYSKAGYRMMSVVDPALCKKVALKYSLALSGLSVLFPLFDVTTWTFAVDSIPLNCYLSYLSWKFYTTGDSASSRKLFKFSLLYLPALLTLIIISKKSYGSSDVVSTKEHMSE